MVKNKINYLYLKRILKTDIIKYYNFLLESQYWSKEQIENYQNKKLKKIVEFASKYVPFYQKKFRELNLSPCDIKTKNDLYKLPIIRRTDLQNNLNEFLSINYNKYDPIRRFTSGTTGLALHFLLDRKVWGHGWAVKLRSWNWAGYKQGEKIGILAGGSLLPKNEFSLKRNAWLWINNFYSFPIMHMTKDVMFHYTRQIIKKKIFILRGYPSALFTFANYLEKENISIPLKCIITTAEVLYPGQRKLFERIFKCKTFDTYGCTDGNGNASECEVHADLHISFENGIMEIVKNNEEGKDNEGGEILFTAFNNYSLPFIRYAPGDLAIKSSNTKCACGRTLPLVKKIIGRTSDNLCLSNGRIINGLSIPLEVSNIKKFQIVQNKTDELDVNIIKGKASKHEVYKIIEAIQFHAGKEIKINLRLVDEIPLPPSGKFRFIISKLDNA